MNGIMDVAGETAYVVDDTKPASETVLWTSKKTSKFFWRNVISSGSTLTTVTVDNTTSTLTLPFTGLALVCVRGQFPALAQITFTLNNNAASQFCGQNNFAQPNCFHTLIAVKQGDTLKFTSSTPTIQVEVLEI